MKKITHAEFVDAYRTLELPIGSSFDAIRSSYRSLAASFHPDKVHEPVTKKTHEERLKKLNAAHELLRNHFKGLMANHKSGVECICQPSAAEREMAEKQMNEKQMNEKQMAEKQMAEKQMAETSMAETKTEETQMAEEQMDEKPESAGQKSGWASYTAPASGTKDEKATSSQTQSGGAGRGKASLETPENKPENEGEGKGKSEGEGKGKNEGEGKGESESSNSGLHAGSSSSELKSPGQVIVLHPSKVSPNKFGYIAAAVAAILALSLFCSIGTVRLGKSLLHKYFEPDATISLTARHSAAPFVDLNKARDVDRAQEMNLAALEKLTREEDDRHKYDGQIKSHLTRIYDDQLNIQSLNAELQEYIISLKDSTVSPSGRKTYLRNIEVCKEKLFAVTDDLRNVRTTLAALQIAHPEIPTEYFAPIPVPPIATNLDPSRAPRWNPAG
jgi:curved DNA-binding protein CbpA